MTSLASVAAVHVLVAVVAYFSLGVYVVFTYNRYRRPEELSRRARVRIALGKLAPGKMLIYTVVAMTFSAVVGTAWYAFVTYVAALI